MLSDFAHSALFALVVLIIFWLVTTVQKAREEARRIASLSPAERAEALKEKEAQKAEALREKEAQEYEAMTDEERTAFEKDKRERADADRRIKAMLERERGIREAEQKKPVVTATSVPNIRSEQPRREPPTGSFLHGLTNAAMICPHCGQKGWVQTRRTSKNRGISGGKATAAILTGGLTLLATGLSRKERLTDAYCQKCKNAWTF